MHVSVEMTDNREGFCAEKELRSIVCAVVERAKIKFYGLRNNLFVLFFLHHFLSVLGPHPKWHRSCLAIDDYC